MTGDLNAWSKYKAILNGLSNSIYFTATLPWGEIDYDFSPFSLQNIAVTLPTEDTWDDYVSAQAATLRTT